MKFLAFAARVHKAPDLAQCGCLIGPWTGYYSLVVLRNLAPSGSPRLHALTGGGQARPEPLSDEQLIDALRRGDQRVAADIYDRLFEVVDRTLYKIFGRREADHDDLVQMAFEQIVITLSRQSFAGACSLRTWASKVTSHVGLNALRSRRRERKWLDRMVDVLEESDRRPSTHDLERSLEARARLERVRRHLVEMNEKQAETLFLHDALGHELAEIALMTGVSVTAAQSRLVRGRKELFSRLASDAPRADREGFRE